MHDWRLVLLPELRRFPTGERRSAIRHARDTELDLLELAGAALALLLATWATRYAVSDVAAASTRLLACLLDFGVALPVVAAAFLPFHLRRVRRGLREQLARGTPQR